MGLKLKDLDKVIIVDGSYTNYTVSTTGIVINTAIGKIIAEHNCSSGNYKQVHLFIDGKDKKLMVHRLVATAYIPNPDNKPQVNHIDNNTFNNNVTNLEWCTAKENIAHMIASGHQVVGINHKNATHTELQIHQACKMLEDETIPFSKISEDSGVSIKTLKNIAFYNGWKHISKGYKIVSSKRKQGPKLSPRSKFILELIRAGYENHEIYEYFGFDGSIPVEKSLTNTVYHLRKI